MMNALKDYSINFKGLKNGIHHYDFTVNRDFFKHFVHSEITEGHFSIHIELTKKTRFMVLHFTIEGNATLQCDKCLDYFELPLSYENDLYIKFYNEIEEEDDTDIIYLPPNEDSIELAQYIYESIILSIPYKRVHPLDESGNATCDASMIQKLNEHEQHNANHEQIDPRWSKLKHLLENNN